MKKMFALGMGIIAMSTILFGCTDDEKEMKNPFEVADESNQMINEVAEVQLMKDKGPIQFGNLIATINQVSITSEELFVVEVVINNIGDEMATLITNEFELRYYEDGKYDKLLNVYLPTLIDGSIDIQAGESRKLKLNYAYEGVGDIEHNSLLRFKTFEKDQLSVIDVPIQNYINN